MATPLAMQITTGILCASYWRGAWYVLDYKLFPSDRRKSGLASFALGGALLSSTQYILSPSYNGTKLIVRMLPLPSSASLRRRYIQTNRFIMLYGIAMSCILLWRGTWLMWDEGASLVADALAPKFLAHGNKADEGGNTAEVEKSRHHPLIEEFSHMHHHHHAGAHVQATSATPATSTTSTTSTTSMIEQEKDKKEEFEDEMLYYSGIACHVMATAGLLFMGRYMSVMAPPANICMLQDLFLHEKGKAFARAARLFARPR